MATGTVIKWSVKNSDPDKAKGGGEPPPKGVYLCKITQCILGYKKNGTTVDKTAPRIEVVYEIMDKGFKGYPLYDYVVTNSEAAEWKLDQFMQAVGEASERKREGSTDLKKLVGKKVKVRVKHETYNEEPRAKVGSVMPYDENEDEAGIDDADESDPFVDEDEDEEVAVNEESITAWGEQADEGDEASIAQLESLAAEAGLDPNDYPTWVELADAIIAETPAEEDEEDEEDEEIEEEAEEEVDYASMDLADLKAEAEARDLQTTGSKALLIKRLEQYDSENPF